MIDIHVDPDTHIVTFKNSGVRTDLVARTGTAKMQELHEQYGKLRVLLDWTEFKGIDAKSDSATFWATIMADITVERLAVVCGEEWLGEVRVGERVLQKTKVKRFTPDEHDAARTWLLTGAD